MEEEWIQDTTASYKGPFPHIGAHGTTNLKNFSPGVSLRTERTRAQHRLGRVQEFLRFSKRRIDSKQTGTFP